MRASAAGLGPGHTPREPGAWTTTPQALQRRALREGEDGDVPHPGPEPDEDQEEQRVPQPSLRCHALPRKRTPICRRRHFNYDTTRDN